MQVMQNQAVDLLKAMGVDTAGDWDMPKLNTQINKDGGIIRFRDDESPAFADESTELLYREIASDQKLGNLTEVIASPAEQAQQGATVTTVKVKPKNRVAGKKATTKKVPAKPLASKTPSTNGKHKESRYDGFKKFPEWIAHLKKNPKELPKEGVLWATVRELKASGKGKVPTPITKAALLGILIEEFPDRTGAKMETNLNNNVPGRLGWMYGINVWRQKLPDKGGIGYFIKGDGSEPQPNPKADVTAAKPKKKLNKSPVKKPVKPSTAAKPKPKKAAGKKKLVKSK